VYWFLFENLRLIPWIAVPVILEWRIISSAMSIVTMVSILIVAFISDVVQQIRKEIILRIVFSITLSLSFAVAFVFIDGSWRTGATTALSVILIPIWFPTLPRRVKHALRNSTLSFLALIESMYRLFLTIQATFVIFQHSVPLGWRWLRHISQREPFPSTTLEIRKP
jgi:L-rhamnose isomerase